MNHNRVSICTSICRILGGDTFPQPSTAEQGKQLPYCIHEAQLAALFDQWELCWMDVTCIHIFWKHVFPTAHGGRGAAVAVISMPVHDLDSGSPRCSLKSSHKEKKKKQAANPEGSSSCPVKNIKRQSTHLTVSPLYHVLQKKKKFGSLRHCSREPNGVIINIMRWCGSHTDD